MNNILTTAPPFKKPFLLGLQWKQENPRRFRRGMRHRAWTATRLVQRRPAWKPHQSPAAAPPTEGKSKKASDLPLGARGQIECLSRTPRIQASQCSRCKGTPQNAPDHVRVAGKIFKKCRNCKETHIDFAKIQWVTTICLCSACIQKVKSDYVKYLPSSSPLRKTIRMPLLSPLT